MVGIAGLMGAGRTELAMSIFGRSYGHNITGKLYIHGKPVQAEIGAPGDCTTASPMRTEDRKRYGLNLIEDIKRNISACGAGQAVPVGLGRRQPRSRWSPTTTGRACASRRRTWPSITGKLSGGNQQKVVLSKWMFANPDVLILDEPTRGIDVGAKYEIYTIINRLAVRG